MNKRLSTDMVDANGFQRAIRLTRFFNINKMASDFCSAQCIMDNTGPLRPPCGLTSRISDHLGCIFDGRFT